MASRHPRVQTTVQKQGNAYEALVKIEGIVHHVWDAAALLCLDSQPLRYTDLHRRMTALTDRHLSESELTRTRHRLVRRGMIREDPGRSGGSKTYSVTEAGRAHLRQIRILISIAPLLDMPDADQTIDHRDANQRLARDSAEETWSPPPFERVSAAYGRNLTPKANHEARY